MFHYQDTVQQVNEYTGNIVPSSFAQVTVYVASGGTAATLYLDAGGTQSSPNPVTADSVGRFDFYTDSGLYDMYIVSMGAAPYWKRNVVMVNAAEYIDVIAGQPQQTRSIVPVKGYVVMHDTITGHYLAFGISSGQWVVVQDFGTSPPL